MSRIIHTLCTIMSTLVISCKGVVRDCYSTTVSDYDGHQQTTVSGTPCIRWDLFHEYSADDYPDATVYDAANYCRAARYHRLWCYISQSYEWEICGIDKCGDDVLTKCGQLSIESPVVLGRNITFSFTPDMHDPNANLYWQRKSDANAWSTLSLKYKFAQYYTNNAHHLVLTDSAKHDEQNYRVHYYNETMRCRMETKKLFLEGNSCGLLQLRSGKVIRNETVEIEYYPPNNVLANPGNFIRQWSRSFDQKSTHLHLTKGFYEEEIEQSDKYVLKISMFNESKNGKYSVYCGNDLGYTNFVEMKERQSSPIILGLKDIDDCMNCIVGEVRENINVSCVINKGSRPLHVTMTIGNKSQSLDPYNSTSPIYISSILLLEHYHMENVSFSVMNDELSSPLKATAKVFVIIPPSLPRILVPETLREGENINTSCTVNVGRPVPIVFFNISGSKVSSTYLHSSTSSYKQIVSLTTFKREWNSENITCCRYNEWYRNKLECSSPRQVDYYYPPIIKFNIEGSVLNIIEGKKVHVECSAESVPASNISWIEELSDRNVTKTQCNMASNCVLSFDADAVSKRQFICLNQYLTSIDRKHLTVNILEKSDKQALVFSSIFGSCLLVAGIIFAVVLFVVIKKRRQNTKEKKESGVSYIANVEKIRNRHNPVYDLQGYQNKVAHAREVADEVLQYFQSLKKEPRENVDKTYSHLYGTEGGQLLYVDLDFEPKEAPSKGAVVKRRDSPTEYVDIDHVKITAEKDIAHVLEKSDEEPYYSQPVKRKTREDEDNIYLQENKCEISSQPHRSEDGQLIYADLDFDPNEFPPNGSVFERRDSSTEYADIDYVRTKAQKDIAKTKVEPTFIYADEESNNLANKYENVNKKSICNIL